MLCVYFLQQWFDLSDPQAEDMLYDSESMRRFARVELGEDSVPDESTILRFRHLLEDHQLTAAMFATVRTLLEDKRLLLKAGTIVDATILAAPSSTKNATGTRDWASFYVRSRSRIARRQAVRAKPEAFTVWFRMLIDQWPSAAPALHA